MSNESSAATPTITPQGGSGPSHPATSEYNGGGTVAGGTFPNRQQHPRYGTTAEQGLAVDHLLQVQPLNPEEKFFDWSTLHSRTLQETNDIMENRYLATLALYEGVKINVSAHGLSIGLEGFGKLLRHWLHKDDFLAFFRSVKREIRLPLNDPGEDVSQQRLTDLDTTLLDTSKFSGADTRLTSVTYGDGKYGTITVFNVTTISQRPSTIRPVAAMEGVPKIVVEKFADGIRGSSKTTLLMPKDEIWKATEQKKIGARNTSVLRPVLKPCIGGDRVSGIKDSLKTALSIGDIAVDRVIATVPQMVAMLHHMTQLIETIESTAVYTEKSSHCPGVRMIQGPRLIGHRNNMPRIIVLALARGNWVEETMSWK